MTQTNEALWGELRSILQKSTRELLYQDRQSSVSFNGSRDSQSFDYKEHRLADVLALFEPSQTQEALVYLLSCEALYRFDFALTHHLYNTHPLKIKLTFDHFPWIKYTPETSFGLSGLGRRIHDPKQILTEDFWVSQGQNIHWVIDTKGTVLLHGESDDEVTSFVTQDKDLSGEALDKEQRENFDFLLCTLLRQHNTCLWEYERWLRQGGQPGQWGLVPPEEIFKIERWEDRQIRPPHLFYEMKEHGSLIGRLMEIGDVCPVFPCQVPFTLSAELTYTPFFELYRSVVFDIPSLVPNQDLLDYVKACLLYIWMTSEDNPYPRCFMHRKSWSSRLSEVFGTGPERREYAKNLPPLKLTKAQRAMIDHIFARAQR